MESRTCTKCQSEKRPDEFPIDSHLKSGRSPWCLDCHRERNRKYYEANKERSRIRTREYQAANPDKMREYSRRHHRKTFKKITSEEWAERRAARAAAKKQGEITAK